MGVLLTQQDDATYTRCKTGRVSAELKVFSSGNETVSPSSISGVFNRSSKSFSPILHKRKASGIGVSISNLYFLSTQDIRR